MLLECINQTQNIQIIGNAVVTTDLIVDNVLCTDCDDNFHLILQLQQHLQLGIRLETR